MNPLFEPLNSIQFQSLHVYWYNLSVKKNDCGRKTEKYCFLWIPEAAGNFEKDQRYGQ